MKTRIGYVYVCLLVFAFVLFSHAGTAEAGLLGLDLDLGTDLPLSDQETTESETPPASSGPLDLLSGIAGVADEATKQLSITVQETGEMAERTVKSAVEAPLNVGSGITDLLSADEKPLSADIVSSPLDTVSNAVSAITVSVANTADTVLNGTIDTTTQIGHAAENIVGAVLQILPAPSLPPPEEATGCAEHPCPEPESPPAMPQEPLPSPAAWGDPPLQEEDKSASETNPAGSSDDGGDSLGRSVHREDEEAEGRISDAVAAVAVVPSTAPATGMKQDEHPVVDVDNVTRPDLQSLPRQAPEQAPEVDPITDEHRSPWRDEPRPAGPPTAQLNTIPPPQPGKGQHGGCHHLKLADGIIAETTSVQMSGRRIYARNTKLFISKRGNEPPTPPPRYTPHFLMQMSL